MKVSAVVVSHGHARELERSLPALAPQVDELVVIANLPGSTGAVPRGVRVLENPRPLSFAANVNVGDRRDDRRVRPRREPGRRPRAGRGGDALRLRRRRIRAAASPAPGCSGRTAAGSPRGAAFPPSAARSCGARRCGCSSRPSSASAPTTCSTSDPDEPVAGGLAARRVPAACGGRCSTSSAAGTAASATTARTSTSATGRRKAGWERWYVPQAVVAARVRGRDRPALPLAAHALAPARDGPLRAQAPGAADGAVSGEGRPVRAARRPAGRTSSTPTPARTWSTVPASSPSSARPFDPGDEVLDLACGDGGLGEHLLALGLRYRGVDSTAEMVSAARARLGDAAPIEQGDLNDYRPAGAGRGDDGVPRDLLRARPPRVLRACGARTRSASSSSTSTRASTALDDVVADLRAAGLDRVGLRPFFVPQTRALPAPADARPAGAGAQRAARAARPRVRFTYVVAPGVEAVSDGLRPRSERLRTLRAEVSRGVARVRIAGSSSLRARRSDPPPPRRATARPAAAERGCRWPHCIDREVRTSSVTLGELPAACPAPIRTGPTRTFDVDCARAAPARAARLDQVTIASPRVPGGAMSKRL